MVEGKKRKMKRSILLIVWIIALLSLFYITVTSADIHLRSYGWGAVFGFIAALLALYIRKWYEETKSKK